MSVNYMLRMQFGPNQNKDIIISELLELCRKAQISEISFFMFAEEQNDGHETFERLEQWLGSLRPGKSALENIGVDVSLNPWHSLLHGDRNRPLKSGQNWQTMVDWKGNQSQAMVCPLDESWREYYATAMRMFASEGYKAIWIDDDIRYHNHSPLDWGGCFCQLHVDAFNKAAGENVTRQELVEKVLQPGRPHPWRNIWFDLWNKQQCELVSSWRDIVEGAGCRLGMMTSDIELHAGEGRKWDDLWNAVAKKQPPVIRPSYWLYTDAHGSFLVYSIGQMQLNNLVNPDKSERYAEIENFRYGQWNKPFVQIASQMAMSQIFGCNKLAISLFDFMGNLPSDTPSNAEFLNKIKPMLDELNSLFDDKMQPVGIGTPWCQDSARKNQLNRTDKQSWKSLAVKTHGWDYWLGGIGFAFQKQVSETVNAISGKSVWMFNDKQILDMLGKGILLDGPAAEILCQRGFGEYVGIKNPRMVTHADLLYSMEESVDDQFGLRKGARMSVNLGGYCHQMLQGDLNESVRFVSVLLDPTEKQVGHGGWIFENTLGGKIAVVPWAAFPEGNPMEGQPILCEQRKSQLEKIIKWISAGESTGGVIGKPWLVSQFMNGSSGWRGVVWNAGPDPTNEFTVQLPDGMKSIDRALHGQVAQCVLSEIKVQGTRIRLNQPMNQWDFVVLIQSL